MNTSTRKLSTRPLAALALFAALGLAACNNDQPVFKNIMNETAQSGSSFFQETASKAVVRLGNNYYAATASLYYTSVHSTDTSPSWQKIHLENYTGYSSQYNSIRALVTVGSTMYVLTGADSSHVCLLSSTDGQTFTSVTMPSQPSTPSGAYSNNTWALDALYSANGKLFAEGNLYSTSGSGAAGTSYFYLYYLNGSTWTQVSNFSALASQSIRGVVSDGTNYYFASTSQLYTSTDPGNSSGSSLYSGLSSKTIWSIAWCQGTSSDAALYIGTYDGAIYQYQSSTWSSQQLTTSGYLPISKIIEVPSGSGTYIILAGTDTSSSSYSAVGYYEGVFSTSTTSLNSMSFSVGSTNNVVSRTAAIYADTVGSFPVLNFFYDTTSTNLFISISPGTTSTSYYGLYESSWANTSSYTTSWSGWTAQ